MKVLLIKPHETIQEGYTDPPLGLLYIAGTLKENGINVNFIDGALAGYGGITNKIDSFAPDIIGMTIYTAGRHNVFKIAEYAKKCNPATLTVLGGPHSTIMWKQILENYPFIDICVIGEGELAMLDIANGCKQDDITGIACRKNGEIINTGGRNIITDLDSLPFPAWDMVEFEKYMPWPIESVPVFRGIKLTEVPRIAVVFGRGCISRCSFCAVWTSNPHYRCRSAKNMTDELELLNNRFGMKHFIFADDIFSANMRSAKGLCREILARNLKIAWYTATRVDRVDNELLDLMEKAGCYGIGYGIESGSEKILKHMNKGVTLEQAKRAIALTKKTNIKAVGLFIVGYIGETRKTFNETIDFIQKTDPPCVATAGSLALFPGTEVYKLLKDKGIISDEFWLGPQPLMTYYAEHDTYNLNEFRELLLARRKITLFSHLKGKCFYYVGLFLKKHLPPSIYQAMKTIKNRLLSPR